MKSLIVLGIIIGFYTVAIALFRYVFRTLEYRREIERRRTGPPRAYYERLSKPKFLNIKFSNHGNKTDIKKNIH